MARNKDIEATDYTPIIKMLSDFQSKKFSDRLPASTDANLQSLIAAMNQTASFFEAETHTDKLSRRLEEAELITKIGFWELDLETQQGKWTKGHLAIFGLDSTCQTPSFEMFLGFVHPDDRVKIQMEFARIIENRVCRFELDFRILIEDGKTIRWLKECGELELNEVGKPVRISGSIQDMTQSKLAEIELQKTIDTLRSTSKIFEQTGRMAKVGGWELDVGTGRVTMSKETLCLHELDDNYVPPRYDTGAQWYPPEAWPMIQNAVRAALEHGDPYDLESPFITAKGRNIWVRVQGFPVVVDGKVTHLQGTFQDITERKERELENKFVRDAMGFGVWTFDPITRALEWDERMYALFDADPKESSDPYYLWQKALCPKVQGEFTKEFELALSDKKEFNTELEIKLKNGESRYIACRGIVMRNEKNEPIKAYGINWDVTTRVQGELELRAANVRLIHSSKLASLGEMSAGIAHEINNPLAIISGAVELIAKYKDKPEKLEAKMEMIKKSCDRIAKIVSGLKKFSRSGDKRNFSFHSLDLIAQDALVLIEAKSRLNDTPVTLECSAQVPILCDEVEIEQVLVNLIGNAIDAVKDLKDKWVKLSIFEAGTSIVLRVIDSGLGIPEQRRAKLFDPFFTTKKVGEGTGLGLSISKGILDEHQATIVVLNDYPNTCFEIVFPRLEHLKNAN